MNKNYKKHKKESCKGTWGEHRVKQGSDGSRWKDPASSEWEREG